MSGARGSAVYGVLVGAGCAALIACAMTKAPPAAPASVPPPPGAGHDEIAQLDGKIAAARAQMGLPAAQPRVAGVPTPAPYAVPPPSGSDAACHPAASDTCQDTCSLADAICADAARICELAKQLPGDAWAEGKCSSAADTCTAAHERCCGCS